MKAFFLRHQKLHVWLLAEGALLAVFYAIRGHRSWVTWLDGAMFRLRKAIGSLCYRVNFSVAEALCVALAIFAVVYLVWSIAAVSRAKGRRRSRAYSAVLGAVCVGLSIYAGLCYLWGVTYYVDGFQQKSGIYAEKVSEDDLYAVTQYFADQLNATADTVARDQDGRFDVPRAEILAESVHVYDRAADKFPFLAFQDQPPKAIHFSRIMSMLDFTGVYCPFTGESNVNVDAPECLLPSTIAHELAHQRGIASEQECNFLAILSGTTCGSPDYAYSGWLLGYIHLGNALYRADRTRWSEVYNSLSESVRTDLDTNNAYWAQFRSSAVKKVSNSVYDKFLKGYGETDGLKSYGTVVDLLVVYYKNIS